VVEGYLYKDTLVDSEHLEGYYHRLTADDDTELTNEFLVSFYRCFVPISSSI
jgi:hypothetical protein